jgi:protein involved in polysaccharide export with SLBB domain
VKNNITLCLCAAFVLATGLANATNKNGSEGQPTTPPPAGSVNQSSGTQSPQFAERNPRYRIQRDDVLSITFPLSEELNQQVTVQPDGYVVLQTAGSVHLQGLTVPEAVDAIKQAYAKILHNPIVNVDLKDFQRAFFTILGQVNKPGKYDLRYDMTVPEAIAVGGGFVSSAKTQVFLYHRISETQMEARELNVRDFLNGKNVNEQPHLSPGDMIFVPEKFITKFKKYIPYGVALNPQYMFN